METRFKDDINDLLLIIASIHLKLAKNIELSDKQKQQRVVLESLYRSFKRIMLIQNHESVTIENLCDKDTDKSDKHTILPLPTNDKPEFSYTLPTPNNYTSQRFKNTTHTPKHSPLFSDDEYSDDDTNTGEEYTTLVTQSIEECISIYNGIQKSKKIIPHDDIEIIEESKSDSELDTSYDTTSGCDDLVTDSDSNSENDFRMIPHRNSLDIVNPELQNTSYTKDMYSQHYDD